MTGSIYNHFAGKTNTIFVVLPFHGRELVENFRENLGNKLSEININVQTLISLGNEDLLFEM